MSDPRPQSRAEITHQKTEMVKALLKSANILAPIMGADIAKRVGLKSDVSVRLIVNKLRASGWPACSGGSGYWYSEDPSQISVTICELESRIRAVQDAVNGLRRYRDERINSAVNDESLEDWFKNNA